MGKSKKGVYVIVIVLLLATVAYLGGYEFSFFSSKPIDRNVPIETYSNIPSDKLTIQPTDIIFNVSGEKKSAMVGEDVILNVKVTNKKAHSYKGILQLKYSTSAPFGVSEYTDSKVVDVLKGENNYAFTVKTEHFTDKLTVTPILEVYYVPTSNAESTVPSLSTCVLRGTNKVCIGDAPVSDFGYGLCSISGTLTPSSGMETGGKSYDCGSVSSPVINYVPLGNAQEPTFSVMINPTPLYLTDRDCTQSGCPTNYDCQTSTKTCVRNDVKSLSCVQIGCPVTADKQYECTSAGICAEKVFVYKDCTSGLQCPYGTSCDTASKTCINTVLIDKIVQCSQNSDCLVPCQGVTATCSSNKCSYSGACEQTTVQCLKAADCPAAPCAGIISSCENTKCTYKGSCDPVYLNQDCNNGATCPDGYSCDKSINPAVCKRDIYIYEDCTAKDYQKSSQTYSSSNPACGKEDRKLDGVVIGEVNAYCPDGYSCSDSATNTCEKLKYSCPSDYKCNTQNKVCEKSITLDCNKLGCPQGYTCFNGANGGVCKTEIRKDMDCRDLGCPKDYTCKENLLSYTCNKETTKTEFISTAYVPQWVYGIIIVLIIITVFVILKKRR